MYIFQSKQYEQKNTATPIICLLALELTPSRILSCKISLILEDKMRLGVTPTTSFYFKMIIKLLWEIKKRLGDTETGC